MAKINAVAAATNARYRSLEQEAKDAQSGYVEAYRRNRDASRADWMRIRCRCQPPQMSPVCPSPEALKPIQEPGWKLARVIETLLLALVDALKTGEALEAGLALCQQELRQCAGLR